MSHPDSYIISAIVRGNTRRLALWPHGEPTSGALRELHYTVKRAASIVSAYDRQRVDIEGNARLSDAAKRDDVHKAALAQLGALKVTHQNLRNEVESIDARRNALLEIKPYAAGDFATVAIDLALATHLRSLSTAEALRAMQADPRVADVIARLPTTLTGIHEAMKARLLTEAAEKRNPGEAKEIATLNEALLHAHEGLANAAQTIAKDAKLDHAQFAPYHHIGSGADPLPQPMHTPEPDDAPADEPAEAA